MERVKTSCVCVCKGARLGVCVCVCKGARLGLAPFFSVCVYKEVRLDLAPFLASNKHDLYPRPMPSLMLGQGGWFLAISKVG